MRTEESHDNIVVLSGIRRRKAIASSPFGPVRAGLITSLRTNEEAQLTELLNSLEKQVATLEYRYYTELGTSLNDLKEALAELTVSIMHTDGTDD